MERLLYSSGPSHILRALQYYVHIGSVQAWKTHRYKANMVLTWLFSSLTALFVFAESTSDIFKDLFRTFHHTKLNEHRTNLPGRCLFEEMAASVGHVIRTDGVRQVTTREFQTPIKPDFSVSNEFFGINN